MNVRITAAGLVGLLLSGAVAFGQAPQAAQAPVAASSLTFDVASVKPSPPLDMQKLQADMQAGKIPNFGTHINGLRAEYNYMAMRELIASAYKVKPYQVTGPAWLATTRFDIVAKMPEGAKKDDAPAMLQALLAERFKLVAHRETQEHPVLALVVSKNGIKMKESTTIPPAIDPDAELKPGETRVDTPNGPAVVTRNKDGSATVNMGAKGIITQRMDMQTQSLHLDSTVTTMDGFADMLTNVMQMGGPGGKQVVNMTGLKGNYEVEVDISIADLMASARNAGFDVPGTPAGGTPAQAPGPAAAADPGGGGTTVFASVEKLGLKLEPRKAPVEQLIVDSMNKTPTED
jgi:uncharacterized protein (TIGR03435 family)